MAKNDDDTKNMFVLNRNHVLSTLKGHSIKFEKGVPVRVPDAVIAEAVAIGATRVDGEQVDLSEPEGAKPVDPDKREPMIREAIAKIKARNERDEFTGTGAPKAKAVSDEVGFKVQQNEIGVILVKMAEENDGQ